MRQPKIRHSFRVVKKGKMQALIAAIQIVRSLGLEVRAERDYSIVAPVPGSPFVGMIADPNDNGFKGNTVDVILYFYDVLHRA